MPTPILGNHLQFRNPQSKFRIGHPLEGATKKGWLKIQQYDHSDALVNTIDAFCFMEIDGDVEFGEETVSYDLICRVLHSTLNTGALTRFQRHLSSSVLRKTQISNMA